MNPTLFFSVCSLFYAFLMVILLYTNNNKKDAEIKILKILSLINIGNLLCEAVGVFLGKNYERFELLNDISLRLMLVFYITWFSFFVFFVLNISKQEKVFSFKNNVILSVAMLIGSVLVIFLPITYVTNSENVIIYSTGPAVQVVYYFIVGSNLVGLFTMFRNVKKIKVIKYTALFSLIILSTVAAVVQSMYPSLLLTASAETFVLYIAYNNIKRSEANK